MASRSAQPVPIYLFLGPEEGEKGAAIAEQRSALQSRTGGELEEFNLYAFDTTPADLVGILLNGSLFGSGTFVRYKAVEQLRRKEEIAPLLKYAASPNETAVLILESSEIRVHDDLVKAAGPAGRRIFWEMFEDQKQAWLGGYFRRHRVAIEPEALELLLELVENNTLDLRHEADKLIAFGGERVNMEDVERFVYHAREENVFTLFDAIVESDLEHALDIASTLLVQQDPVRLVGGIARQIDRILLFQNLREDERDDQRAIAALESLLHRGSGKPRALSKTARNGLLRAAGRFPLSACRSMARLSVDADALFRSVSADFHRGLFEHYLYSLIKRNGEWNPDRRQPWPWEYAVTPAPR